MRRRRAGCYMFATTGNKDGIAATVPYHQVIQAVACLKRLRHGERKNV